MKEAKYSDLYHYNHYNKTWSCFSREDYVNYFNGTEPKNKIGRGVTMEAATIDKYMEEEPEESSLNKNVRGMQW
jgi:hypothetical protein